MSGAATLRAARKAAAYRAEIIQKITAELPSTPTLTLVLMLGLARQAKHQMGKTFQSAEELCREIGARASKGNPRQTRFPEVTK